MGRAEEAAPPSEGSPASGGPQRPEGPPAPSPGRRGITSAAPSPPRPGLLPSLPHAPPRHLRPRHLLIAPAPGGGAGLASGGTIPHSPSGEGEPPPGRGSRYQRRAERGIPPPRRRRPPPPCGEAGRAPLRPRRRAEAGAPPCPPQATSGRFPTPSAGSPSITSPSMLEPLPTAAAPLPGAGIRGLSPPPSAALLPRCHRSPPCPPGGWPAALPLRDGLLPQQPLFSGEGGIPHPSRRPPPQG